jgi:hypothetical protein
MHRILASLVAAALLLTAAPVRSDAQSLSNDLISTLVNLLLNTSNTAPPALPQYYQSPAQQQNQIWQPGYWANTQGGYFWVPGTWVTPPQQNMLWTPGYWGSNNGAYQWSPGYWSQNVGYYGDVNYGNGYYGTGYAGGQWRNNTFYYNTAVSNIQPTITRYVYVDREVLVNKFRGNHISYHGGRGGIVGEPTLREMRAGHEHHYQMTRTQQQYIVTSSENHHSFENVNHGKPAFLGVPKPPEQSRHAAPLQYSAPVVHEQQPVRHEQQPARHEQQPVHHEQQPVQQPQQALQHQHQPVQQPQPAVHQHEHQQNPDQKHDQHAKPDAKPTLQPELKY